MPRLLDISGSANWANKADFGLSYHRGENNSADLCVTKVRKGYPGRRGNVKVGNRRRCKVRMRYGEDAQWS
jgi:twinkle protein